MGPEQSEDVRVQQTFLPQTEDVMGFSPPELRQGLLTKLSATPVTSVRKYATCTCSGASQGGYTPIDASYECSQMRILSKESTIYDINPPQFALPNSLFWDMIFGHLDQADFGALAW